MTRHSLALLAATLLAAALLLPTAHAQSAHRRILAPDPKLLPKLNPEQQFGPFRLRSPRGYKLTKSVVAADKANITEYEMKSPMRKDGTIGALILVVATGKPGHAVTTNNKLIDSDSTLLHEPDLSLTPKEAGTLNGLPILRRQFRYHQHKGDKIWLEGFQYATTDGETSAIIMALDEPPDADSSMPILDASTLTLRKTR